MYNVHKKKLTQDVSTETSSVYIGLKYHSHFLVKHISQNCWEYSAVNLIIMLWRKSIARNFNIVSSYETLHASPTQKKIFKSVIKTTKKNPFDITLLLFYCRDCNSLLPLFWRSFCYPVLQISFIFSFFI